MIHALARIDVVDVGDMDPRCASAPMYRGTGCCLMINSMDQHTTVCSRQNRYVRLIRATLRSKGE